MRIWNRLIRWLFRLKPERLVYKDILEIKHIRNGKVIATRHVENIITNTGLAAFAGLLNGVITNFFDYIAIGTGTVAPAVTDTALGAEITTGGGARTAATCSRVTTTITNDTSQLVATFNFTASFAITEEGVFDSASGGVMPCRQTFAALNVVSGDAFQATHKIVNARP